MKTREVKLGEVANVKGGKRIPKGIGLINIPNGHPYIRVRDLNNKRVLELDNSYEYVDNETQKVISKYTVKTGDVVLSIVGTIGLVAIVGRTLDGANLTENCVKLSSFHGVNRDFLYYYLRSDCGQQEIRCGTVGAVQAKLPIKNIQNIAINLPDYTTQERIASLLLSIDRKIELNQKINDNLSDVLQTIYQGQFGKVGLANNCGILADICSYSKDKIEISKLSLDTYYSTENMLPEKSGAVKATSLPTTSQTTACHKGDTLISNIRPYFKKIVYCEDDCGCSTDVLCFKPVHPRYTAYLFSTLYADSFFNFMVAGAKGTKMPRGDKQQIMTYPVVLPSEKDLSEFNSVATPILTQIYSNRTEFERLSAIRDTLLPKLILGEIDVSSIQL